MLQNLRYKKVGRGVSIRMTPGADKRNDLQYVELQQIMIKYLVSLLVLQLAIIL